MGAALCVLAALTSYFCTRRSARLGLLAVFFWGVFYGILRANYLDLFTHFIFDASLLSFYAVYPWKLEAKDRKELAELHAWFYVLVGWAVVVAFFPFQHPLITLVGFRGNVFFLPMLLVGARLTHRDLFFFATGVAILNLAALGFGFAEYAVGVQKFYPFNAVTQIIYNSNDVAGHRYLRIPATFVTAHAFGGCMASTIPLLFGAWSQPAAKGLFKLLFALGLVAAAIGVLLSSTRVNFLFAALLAVAAVLTAKMSTGNRFLLVAALALITLLAAGNERLSRFKSLGESGAMTDRLGGSVNRTFWEIAAEYPMGNGLGGGGTSVPFFLAPLVNRPVGLESEYSRIMLEQGIPGLILWLVFFVRIVTGSRVLDRSAWKSGRILAWFQVCFSLVSGAIGLGLMTAIPQSLFFLLYLGWIAVKPPRDVDTLLPGRRTRSAGSPRSVDELRAGVLVTGRSPDRALPSLATS